EVTGSTYPVNVTNTRTWTFTDACDNFCSITETITVGDTTAPEAPAAPADMTVECMDEVPAAEVLMAMDNCAGEIQGVVSEITDNTSSCNVTITRTWTFTDACDNSSSISQTITVSDTTAPEAPVAPAD